MFATITHIPSFHKLYKVCKSNSSTQAARHAVTVTPYPTTTAGARRDPPIDSVQCGSDPSRIGTPTTRTYSIAHMYNMHLHVKHHACAQRLFRLRYMQCLLQMRGEATI
jgi:hypothetical protein